MGNSRSTSKIELTHFRLGQICIWVTILTTFAINPFSNYDPISVVKMLPLTVFAFLSFGLFNSQPQLWKSTFAKNKTFTLLLLFFCLTMVITIFTSGAGIAQQFWGTFGRNTGFLTYFSLCLVSLAFLCAGNLENVLKIRNAFLITSVPMTIYGVMQFVGQDPITWSEQAVFGTLGNINFLSAFFGMSSIAILSRALELKNLLSRLSLILLVMIDLYLIVSTGSIQGPLILIIGLYTLILILLLMKRVKKLLIGSYLLSGVIFGGLGLAAIFNKGPLNSLIYQPSIVFRGDYMHAAWEMFKSHPFTGVGMDSYGDWYREARGQISTLRTGPDRVSNAAHNVYLDFFSNGGFVLGTIYILVILFTFIIAFKAIILCRKVSKVDTLQAGLFSTWLAYQIQAAISINQIGIAVWGWLLTAGVYSYSRILLDTLTGQEKFQGISPRITNSPTLNKHRKTPAASLLPAKSLMFMFIFGIFGFLLAVPPLSADAAYRKASSSGSFKEMKEVLEKTGSTQWHVELVLDYALRSNNQTEVDFISKFLVEKYPRSFFGWQIRATFPESRSVALQRLKELDPYNPTISIG